MSWDLKINKIPVKLGQKLPPETLDTAEFRRAGLLRRVFAQQPVNQTVYDIEDCELEDLDTDLHIYPCTHSYLNADRQWRTKVTLFLKHDRLQRILFQVVEGQTAAINFLERFEASAVKALGEPYRRDRRSTSWRGHGAVVEAKLHRDRVNADFNIALDDETLVAD